MSAELASLKGKKVSVLVTGAKGIASFHGELAGVDGEFIKISIQKGMLGSKEKLVYFSKYGIIGIRVEE